MVTAVGVWGKIATAFLLTSCTTLSPNGSIEKCLAGTDIALDIGHSPKAPGAKGARAVDEYYFNKAIVDLLVSELTQIGAAVDVINEDGEEISLTRRREEILGKDPDIFVSVHHDSVQPIYLSEWKPFDDTELYSDIFSGFSLFISRRSQMADPSIGLASSIGREFRARGRAPTYHHAEAIEGEAKPIIDYHNGVFAYDGLAVLRENTFPSVLIEVGVIVNRREELLLSLPQHQAETVNAIAKGICRFKSEYSK